ncbi:unnamed protein product [Sphenostylis stenocarpa]|uniref:Uncharacterized protein n=1 Tax=Sphenostylis stenocarpa TaxID=92480 RepID=A0AA86W5U7_9FABA|nr:unnamed protein product [Sphenostylis stenocarpa]
MDSVSERRVSKTLPFLLSSSNSKSSRTLSFDDSYSRCRCSPEFTMDLRFKNINWVENICQKFETVCQEVDDIVCQDAVKYLENQVQNVGDSVKIFYSGIVDELLPSFHEDHHAVAETNSIDFSDSAESDNNNNNKKWDEENPIHHCYGALMDSNSIDIADNKHQACSVEDSYISHEEEVGLDDSRVTPVSKNENIYTSIKESVPVSKNENIYTSIKESSIKESVVESVSKPTNLISLGKRESLEFSFKTKDMEIPINYFCLALHDSDDIDVADIQKASGHTRHILANKVSDESCSVSLELENSYITEEGVSDDPKGTSGSTKENIHTSIEEVVEEVAVESVPKPMNLISVEGKESLKFPIPNEYSDSCDFGYKVSIRTMNVNAGQNSCLINAMNTSPVMSSQSLEEESINESIKVSVYVFPKSSDTDQNTHDILADVLPEVAVSSERSMTKTEPSCFSCSLPMNKSKSQVTSIASCMETIQLNDDPDPKPEKDCVNVQDRELHAVVHRTRKLRSYKEKIRDAFSSKKRLSKEYEQLAIWYGDSKVDFSSKKVNMDMELDTEIDWELV